jgi:hypothetical protein
VTFGRHSKTVTVTGATRFPSITNFPTASVYSLDEQDSKGWMYCYGYGGGEALGREFASLFPGDMFETIFRSCRAPATEVDPLGVVAAASFLLDETTSYVDSTETDSSVVSHSHTTESSRTSAPVLVDPFRPISDSTAKKVPSSTEKSDETQSTTAKSTQPDITHAISEFELFQTGDNPPPAQTTRRTASSKGSAAFLEVSRSSIQSGRQSDSAEAQGSVAPKPSSTEEQTTSHVAPASAVDTSVLQNSKLLASSEAIVSPNSVRFFLLNSLIQDIGRIQPSSMKEASEDIARTLAQSELSTVGTATTSLRPVSTLIGTKTLATDTDGKHPLQPTESDEREGTMPSVDKSADTFIIDGISTHHLEASQTADGDIQALALTMGGTTATLNSNSEYIANAQTMKPGDSTVTASDTHIDSASGTADLVVGSHTSTLSATKGIGDYVWAGIADLLPAASSSKSPASNTPTGVPPTSLDPVDSFARPLTLISAATAIDAEVSAEGSPVVSTVMPDSSSTRTTNADNELREVSTTSDTNTGTASRIEPAAVFSSPSNLQGPSPENRSGPSISTPSVGIYVSILVVFVMSG